MTPTQEAIVKLRLYLDEKIPPGGSQDDTRFSDTELEVLLDDFETIYGAASLGWSIKAAMIQKEMGDIEETRTGQETYRYVQLKDRLAHAQTMAEDFQRREQEELGKKKTGSCILRIAAPEVL